jgi:repressor of nif and glnA expression
MTRKDVLRVGILKVMASASSPMGASRIRAALEEQGLDAQERTIRFHLLQMDRAGLTEIASRRAGRILLPRGREELSRARIFDKIGVVSSKVDTLAYQMTFRPTPATGSVVMNVSLIYPEHVSRALNEMKLVFRQNLAIGSRIAVASCGEEMARTAVPENYVGIGTVCSVTVSGALLHEGIPVRSRFGGLLEIRNHQPTRFVELIEYQGSTLDPLEVFIQANMTRVRDVLQTGSGIICAGFREIPSVALEDVRRIEKRMRSLGLGGIAELGRPNQSLLGIPVSEGHAGMIVYGGLNPIALLHETGLPVVIRSLAGLEDFKSLKTVDEWQRRMR